MRVPHSALRDRITVEDFGGAGSMGATYGAAREVPASFQSTTRVVADSEGNVVTTASIVIIRPEAGPVPPESRVTYLGVAYRVVQADPYPDARRPSHWELVVARA